MTPGANCGAGVALMGKEADMNEQPKFKRRKYFLKDSSQLALILKVYIMFLVVMLISGVIFYFIGNKNLTSEFYQAHSVLKNTMQLLMPALILVNIVGLLGAFFLVVSFTHSISGPIYRLKLLSEKIAAGDLTVAVKFRKEDAVHELSEVVNKIISELGLKIKGLQDSLLKLKQLEDKTDNIDKLSSSELLEFKNIFLAISNEIEQEIKKFKL